MRLFLAISLISTLACMGSSDPEPPSTPANPQPSLGSLPQEWVPIIQTGGVWKIEDPCGINSNIILKNNQLSSGGCGGTITSTAPAADSIAIILQDENSGSSVTATFRWIDQPDGIGEWTWPGCMPQPLPHVDAAHAAGMPKAPGNCGDQ
jgi:hypothetical protein